MANDHHRPLLKGSTDLYLRADQSYGFPLLTSQPLPAALVGVLPETPYRNVAGREYHLIEQRRGEKNQEQKFQEGVFHLGSGYPVKTDAFMSSSFNRREKAAQVAGQWHVQAGPR